MNFFKSLPLTTKILAGAAGIGAAALVGYGVLTAPEDSGNAFFDNGRQNIEYVAGAEGSVAERELISSRNVGIVDEQAMQQERAREALEMRKEQAAYDQLNANSEMPATGAAVSYEGIGLNNGGYEGDTNNLTLPTNIPGMGDLAGMIGNAVGGANGGAGANGALGAKGEAAANGQQATLQRASMANPVKVGGVGGASASGGNSGQGVQNVWSAGGGAENSGEAQKGLDILNNAMGMIKEANEGAKLVGRPIDNKPRFGTENALSRAGKGLDFNGKGGNDLERFRASAKKIANSKYLPANAPAHAWMGSDVEGGITIGGTTLVDNLGNGATDDQKFTAGLKNAGNYLDGIAGEMRDREKDGNSLKKHLWITFGIVLALAIAIPWLKHIWIFGVNLGVVAFAVGLAAIAALGIHIGVFSSHWKFEGIAITATAVGAAMTAGLLLSFFLSGGQAVQQGAQNAGLSGAPGGAAAGSTPGGILGKCGLICTVAPV